MKRMFFCLCMTALLGTALAASPLRARGESFEDGQPGVYSAADGALYWDYYSSLSQEEFNLQCNNKTSEECTVYDYRGGVAREVATLPAGTYVLLDQARDEERGGPAIFTFMVDGQLLHGVADVDVEPSSSVVRTADGWAHNVHELDPEYDAKVAAGTLEYDVKTYSDRGGYYAWKGGYATEPPRKNADGSSPATPPPAAAVSAPDVSAPSVDSSAASARQSRPVSSAAPRPAPTAPPVVSNAVSVQVLELGTVYTTVQVDGEKQRVRTADLVFSDSVPAEKAVAVIYAPKTGKASLRASASEQGKLLKKCGAGTVVSVLALGERFTLVNYKGTAGYVLTSCLRFYDPQAEAQGDALLSYNGYTNGGTTINIRNAADKGSAKIAEWATGTAVTVLGSQNGWYEIEARGMRGFVMDSFITLQ